MLGQKGVPMVTQRSIIKRGVLVGGVGGALFLLAFGAVVVLIDAIDPGFFRLMDAVVKDEYERSDRPDQSLILFSAAGAQLWIVGIPLMICLMVGVAWVIRRMVRRAPTSVPHQKQALGKSLVPVIGGVLVLAMPALRGLVQQAMITAGWRVPDTVLIATIAVLCLASFGAVTGWLESLYLVPHAGSEPDQVSGPPSPLVGNRGGAEANAAADRPRE
jgi:hypothetical protein